MARKLDHLMGFVVLLAVFVPVKLMTATAAFNDNGVTGTITLTQSDALSPTMMDINLDGLNNEAGGFHVHVLPVPSGNPAGKCGMTGGHYNPFEATVPCPSPTVNNICEIGDLSAAAENALNGQTKATVTYADSNLPLHGPFSVVGRSIVIHKAADASRWVCANIVQSEEVTEAIVPIAGSNITGTITLTQVKGQASADTTVLVQLHRTVSSPTSTMGHKWHIHVNPATDADCASTGGHYNPTNVCLTEACGYSRLCGQGSRQSLCEVGDLAGKNGLLTISTDATDTSTQYLYTDAYLPLTGPDSILGRSIVIHAENSGAPRLACGNIPEQASFQKQTTTEKPPKGAGGGGRDGGEVAGIVIGVLVLVGIIAAVAIYVVTHNRKSVNPTQHPDVGPGLTVNTQYVNFENSAGDVEEEA